MELIIPNEVDHIRIIAAIGQEEKQETEYGGLYNQVTRSILVNKGFRAQGFDNPQVEFVPPRRNEDGVTTDDIFWHTHPWDSKSPVGFFREPKNACLPSNTDSNALLAAQMIEEEAGNEKPIISITTSGGYVTISEAKGIRLNIDILKQLGLNENRIRNIMTDLALAPEEYFLNAAPDSDARLKLKELLENLYFDRRSDKNRSVRQKIDDFKEQAKQYTFEESRRGVRENTVERLAEQVYSHFPKLPSNIGDLTTEQSKAVLEMTGFSTTTTKV
ncbi:MAG: hypothetical protein KJ915_02680 [Candidatus Omnitrophica bacterium]|nr:hypothetical protein [Candidatus Omnitrophota bacterium]